MSDLQFSKKRRTRKTPPLNTASAALAIGPITEDTEVYGITDGSISLIDILSHIATEIPDSDLTMATWTAAHADITKAEGFLTSNRVSSVQIIADPSFYTRKPDICENMLALFGPGAVRFVPLHAKFAVFTGGSIGCVIRTSMNLNPNNRIESYEISTDPEMVDYHAGLIKTIFERFEVPKGKPSNSRKHARKAGAVKTETVLPF